MDTEKNKRTFNGQIKDIMDKIKKLTKALYRVTDLYSNKEPLKWVLRKNAINLHSNLMFVMSDMSNNMSDMSNNMSNNMPDMSDNMSNMSNRKNIIIFEEIMNSISQIIYNLEIAPSGSYILDTNFEILKNEYILLKSFIEGGKGTIFKEQKLLIERDSVVYPDNKQLLSLKNIDININNNRKQKILDFIRKNGIKKPITIKEIGLIFENISLKSIQRDLLDLIKSGAIKAKGERRGRTYFL